MHDERAKCEHAKRASFSHDANQFMTNHPSAPHGSNQLLQKEVSKYEKMVLEGPKYHLFLGGWGGGSPS